MVEGIGEDVYDAPANSVLAGLVDKIDFAESVFDEHFVQEVHRVLFPEGEREGLLGEFALADDALRDGFAKGDDGQSFAVPVDLVEHLGTHGDVGVFRDFFLVRNPRRAWEKQHVVCIPDELLQVVEEVGSRFLVVEDE